MAEIRPQRYVIALFVGAFSLFVANKLAARPALESQVLPEALRVLTDSIPNVCEAVMGLTILAGAYVLTQEVGFHNLGGNNVFDPNDVVASLSGLAVTAGLFLRYGVLEHETSSEGSTDSA